MLAPALPDLSQLDREALQALLLAEHQERIATHQQLLQRESEIETLKLLLSQLRRMQFGRKSEKLQRQIEQLELRLEDLQQAQAAEETSETGPAESSPPVANLKAVRRLLPEHLPRQTHEPKHSACPGCGGELRKLGEDVSETLSELFRDTLAVELLQNGVPFEEVAKLARLEWSGKRTGNVSPVHSFPANIYLLLGCSFAPGRTGME